MSFIKLSQLNGEEIHINLDNVTCMMPAGSETIIYLNGGELRKHNVKEDIVTICRLSPKHF